jgi:aminopeptidase YwaD
MTEEEGDRLAEHEGEDVSLDIRALRSPARGYNVVARKGGGPPRAVLCAHIDTKDGTPGALDNAGGVVVLLLVAELLADYEGELAIEIVALNGEDYYSSPGQQAYLRKNAGKFDEMLLVINLDGAGYKVGDTAYSLYDCPPQLSRVLEETFAAHAGLVQGEPWYQGDHSIFLMNKVPAVAMTSTRMMDVLTGIAHTPRDQRQMVDVTKLVGMALAIRDALLSLERLA